jgi:PAS domain S-box-containing protein
MEKAKIEILLIEDNLAEADLMRELLSESRWEFSVEHVQYLADGLDLLKSRRFDVVLVDLGLPDSQGMETVLAIRNHATGAPVVVLTTLDDLDVAIASLQMDIQDYLVKGESNSEMMARAIRYAIERKRIEEELRESEQRFATFMLNLPAAAWMKDLEGRYVYVNAEAERVIAAQLDEVKGKSDEEIFLPETARQFRENDRRVLAEGVSIQTTEALRQTDGSEHYSIVSKFAMPGPNGRPQYVAGVAFDITERKRMEESLKESEARFRALVTASSEVLYRMSPDWSEMRQLYSQKFLASTESPSRTWLQKYIHPDDQPHVTAVIREAIRTRSVFEMEHRVWRPDGSLGWTFSRAVPLLDANGEIVEWFGAASDITEHKQAEEALQKSEEKFSMIFNTAPVGITISTLADGRFVDINAAAERFSGYRRDEVIGHTALEFDIWKDPLERAHVVEEILKQGGVHDREMMMKDKGGNAFWALYSAVVVEIRGEKYLLSLVSNITDRKRAEEEIERLNTDLAARAAELEAANRELEAFNYTVAHDLRKPLTTVNGYCQVIRELCGDKLDEQCKGYLREAYDGTLRMNGLIDALLNFSRLAHVEPRRETVDLTALAKGAAAELKVAEPERRVTLRIAEGMRADGDAKLLQVVLENLLGNAWKFTAMREEGTIELGMTEFDGRPACFVRDNGPGFDEADAAKLFVPFQRLPGAEEVKGFGIGLATVERIIRRHGGRVWAEGAPGRGATFYFTLGGDRST